MALPQPVPPDSEATPSFNARCLELIQGWRTGALPFTEAIAQVTALAQEASHNHHTANQARAEMLLGYIQHNRGNLNTGLGHYERARLLYKQVGNARRIATIDLNMGESYRYKGDFTRARQLFHAAYESAAQLGFVQIQAVAIANEGQMLLSMGQLDSAYRALEEGHQLAEAWRSQEDNDDIAALLCEIHYGLTMIHLADNRVEDAWNTARIALDTANATKRPMELGFANRAVGEALSMLEQTPEADFSSDPDDYFRAAIEAFREINMEGELGRTMFAQARSLARRGRRTSAARKLQQVMIIFTKLGMQDDASKAAELQLSVL